MPVRRNGELREHRPVSTVERAVDLCPGSGEKPEGLFDDAS